MSFLGFLGFLVACSTLPTPKVKRFAFPKEVYLGEPKRAYEALGVVRTKIEYQSLDPVHDEAFLCKNYFNKAAHDLLKRGKAQGADAVIDMKSVVFLFDGRTEMHSSPQCSDDGGEGQVLAQGIAVKWKTDEAGRPLPTQSQPLSEPKPKPKLKLKPELKRKPEPQPDPDLPDSPSLEDAPPSNAPVRPNTPIF